MNTNLDMPDKLFGVDTQILLVFVVPAAVSIGCLLTILGIVVPKIGEIGDLNSKAGQFIKDRQQLESKRNYLLSVDQDMIARNSDALNMAMLKNKDAYVLVNVIRTVASGYGFDVDSFAVSPGVIDGNGGAESKASTKAQQNNLVRIPVNLTLVGPQDKFMDLVSGLERALPILSINKLDTKTNGNLAQLDMSISSYFSTDKTSVKVNSLSLADLTLSQTENDLIKTIAEYQKTTGLSANESGLTGEKDFTSYTRENPFSL